MVDLCLLEAIDGATRKENPSRFIASLSHQPAAYISNDTADSSLLVSKHYQCERDVSFNILPTLEDFNPNAVVFSTGCAQSLYLSMWYIADYGFSARLTQS